MEKKSKGLASTVILLVSVMLLMVVSLTRLSGGTPSIFGHTFHVVVSDSMTPDIEVGDFMVGKMVSIEDVEVGDFVLFESEIPFRGQSMVVHECIEIQETDGKIFLTTRGTKEGAPIDKEKVSEENFLGVYSWKSSAIGWVMLRLGEFATYVFILVGIVLFKIAKKLVKSIKQEVAIQKQLQEEQCTPPKD